MSTREEAYQVIRNASAIMDATMTLAFSSAFEALGDRMAQAFEALGAGLSQALGGEAAPPAARTQAATDVDAKIREALEGFAIPPDQWQKMTRRLTDEHVVRITTAARTHLVALPPLGGTLSQDQLVGYVALGLANDERLGAFMKEFMAMGQDVMGGNTD